MHLDNGRDAGSRLKVRCRAKSGSSATLELLDISAGGCMVTFRGLDAAPGDRVLMTLRGLDTQPGQMVWIEDGRAGIAFEQPLHEAVYDHLVAQMEGRVETEQETAARTSAAQVERRRAARRKMY